MENKESESKKEKFLAITNRGIEFATKLELEEAGFSCEIVTRGVIFYATLLEVQKFSLYSQSTIRILRLIGTGKIKDFEDIFTICEPLDYGPIENDFSVECERDGEHLFNSPDITSEVSGIICKKSGKRRNYKTGQKKYFCFVYDKDFYVGEDILGFDMSKREYRIFLRPRALKANIAYALARFGGVSLKLKKGISVIDLICGAGEVMIESALYLSHTSALKYSSGKIPFELPNFEKVETEIKPDLLCFSPAMNDVLAAQKNAKIAGLNKIISFSRVSLDDLELKFPDFALDMVISNLPGITTNTEDSKVEEVYFEIFRQLEALLKKDGTITFATINPELLLEIAKSRGFIISEQIEVWQGQQLLYFVKLVRQAKN